MSLTTAEKMKAEGGVWTTFALSICEKELRPGNGGDFVRLFNRLFYTFDLPDFAVDRMVVYWI
jgi:hypothetical protein